MSISTRRLGRAITVGVVSLWVLGACSSEPVSLEEELAEFAATSSTAPAPSVATSPTVAGAPRPSTTSTTTTSSTSTTTTTPADAPGSTLVTPDNIGDVFVEAFAAYEEAWSLRQEAARSPGDRELLQQLEERYDDPFLSQLLEGNAERAADGVRTIATPDRPPPSVRLVGGIGAGQDGQFVEFSICETLTERVVDSTETVIYDEVVSLSGLVRMSLDGDRWRVFDEVTTKVTEGLECE